MSKLEKAIYYLRWRFGGKRYLVVWQTAKYAQRKESRCVATLSEAIDINLEDRSGYIYDAKPGCVVATRGQNKGRPQSYDGNPAITGLGCYENRYGWISEGEFYADYIQKWYNASTPSMVCVSGAYVPYRRIGDTWYSSQGDAVL